MKIVCVQLLMAMLGSLCFAVIFNVHGVKKLDPAAIGGILNWATYLAVFHFTANRIMGFFFATVVTALLAELFARIVKTPVIVLLVPMLIPLIPGGDLYYTMQNMVYNQIELFLEYGERVLKEAAAIAFGILFAATFVQLFTRILKYRSVDRPS